MLRALIHLFFLPVREAALRIGLLAFSKTRIEGFDVVDWAGLEGSFSTCVHRLKTALQLIREKDPRRFKRVQRDVRRFLVAETSGEEFLPSIRACLITITTLKSRTTEEIAMTIVHEATHARFHSRGIDYSYRRRARIEEACVASEVAFSSLLPNGKPLAIQARAKLDRQWWTRENELTRRLQDLELLGWPSWYRHLCAFLYRP